MYRPPSGNVKIALNKIKDVLESYGLAEETVLLGDFNVDWSQTNKPAPRILRDLVGNRSLTSYVDSPTRVTLKSSSTIDLVFSNITYVSLSGMVDLSISDHFPVFIIKKKQRTHRPFIEKWCRPLRNLDWMLFAEELKTFVSNFRTDSRDPSKIWDVFYGKIIQVLDKICPLKLVRFYTDSSTYINDELRQLMRERDIAFWVARKRGSLDDWYRARILGSRVQSEMVKAKRRFILRQLEAADGDGKKFWNTINSVFLKKSTPPIDRVFRQNSASLVYGTDAADTINEYFCHVSTKLSSKFGPIVPDRDDHQFIYYGQYLNGAPPLCRYGY